MIGRDAILEYSRRKRVNPFWIENDYLQYIVLMELYKEFSNELVFKGGTALQKVYGLERLSRDLDFNLQGIEPGPKLERSTRGINDYYKASCRGPEKLKHGLSFMFYINSPSYEATGRQHQMPITFNLEEKVMLKPMFKTINPGAIYRDPDLHTYSLLAMDESEILAEKVRAAMTRKDTEPRDFYDIWFMLNKGVPLDMAMVSKKLNFAHSVFSIAYFRSRLRGVKENWKQDLGPLIDPLPEYGEVAKYIIHQFK